MIIFRFAPRRINKSALTLLFGAKIIKSDFTADARGDKADKYF